jgi:hypothetical protein
MSHREEPELITSIDAEYLSGRRFTYQEDIGEVEDIDLLAATTGSPRSSTATRTPSSRSTSTSRPVARTSWPARS